VDGPEGDEVGTLLANLVYNHDGRALRIRPSQGDYGIGVIQAAIDSQKWDVYQVKKFAKTSPLARRSRVLRSSPGRNARAHGATQ
jgi:hypothetical protein